MSVFKRLINQYNFSGFPRAIWAVAGMNVVGGIGWSVSFTYLPLYLYQERGLPMTLVGVLRLSPAPQPVSSRFSEDIWGIGTVIAGQRYHLVCCQSSLQWRWLCQSS